MSKTQEAEKENGGTNWLGILGAFAFFVGMLLAFFGGIFSQGNEGVILVLVILGIIVGLLNISSKETMPFLVAAIALVVAGTSSFAPLDKIIGGLGAAIDGIAGYMATFMVPAAIINAIRMVWSVAKPGD